MELKQVCFHCFVHCFAPLYFQPKIEKDGQGKKEWKTEEKNKIKHKGTKLKAQIKQ